jgi:hypothetical protein
MTYKQIETSREIRQWIGLAMASAAAVVGLAQTYPELNVKLKKFGNEMKNKTIKLFKKER